MEHITTPRKFATIRKTDAISVTAERDTIYDNGFQCIEVREGAKGGDGTLPYKWPETRGKIPFHPWRTGTGILCLEKSAASTPISVTTITIRRPACARSRSGIFGETPCVQTRANSARFKLLYQNCRTKKANYPRYAKVLMPTPPGEKNRAVEYLTGKKYFLRFRHAPIRRPVRMASPARR